MGHTGGEEVEKCKSARTFIQGPSLLYGFLINIDPRTNDQIMKLVNIDGPRDGSDLRKICHFKGISSLLIFSRHLLRGFCDCCVTSRGSRLRGIIHDFVARFLSPFLGNHIAG